MVRGQGLPSAEAEMLDLVYLATGIGVLILFVGYAAALRRL